MPILLVPRWSGTLESDWYPWLRAQLAEPVTAARLLPEPGAPTIETMLAQLRDLAPPETLADTLLVGHSVGCQALLRYAASLPPGVKVRGLVAVAGWLTLDRTWPAIRPWVETPIDLGRAREALGFVQLTLSDDDPFTADHEANAALWREQLGAEVRLVPGARHFNGAQEPAALEAVQRALAR
ncbi:MAG: alpha/beta hydrolase [Alphaproteobacteria bacterium]|nr:alpha/beta hydrolase [Alphaproteobacteria bacterium]